jgi:hypothetical protein
VRAQPVEFGFEFGPPRHEHHDDIEKGWLDNVGANDGLAVELGLQFVGETVGGADDRDLIAGADAELARERDSRIDGSESW